MASVAVDSIRKAGRAMTDGKQGGMMDGKRKHDERKEGREEDKKWIPGKLRK